MQDYQTGKKAHILGYCRGMSLLFPQLWIRSPESSRREEHGPAIVKLKFFNVTGILLLWTKSGQTEIGSNI